MLVLLNCITQKTSLKGAILMSGDDKRLNDVTCKKHWNGVTRAKNIAMIDSPCVPCVFVPHLERYSPPPVQQHAIHKDEQVVEKRTKSGNMLPGV